jgi:hypothetical protein
VTNLPIFNLTKRVAGDVCQMLVHHAPQDEEIMKSMKEKKHICNEQQDREELLRKCMRLASGLIASNALPVDDRSKGQSKGKIDNEARK